jgi:hypothetical protein
MEPNFMNTWMLADLDNIIRDFMAQLRTAMEEGWSETRPDRYRAVVAALESALRQRHEVLLASRRRSIVPPEPAAPHRGWLASFRSLTRPRRPVLSPLLVTRGRP